MSVFALYSMADYDSPCWGVLAAANANSLGPISGVRLIAFVLAGSATREPCLACWVSVSTHSA